VIVGRGGPTVAEQIGVVGLACGLALGKEGAHLAQKGLPGQAARRKVATKVVYEVELEELLQFARDQSAALADGLLVVEGQEEHCGAAAGCHGYRGCCGCHGAAA